MKLMIAMLIGLLGASSFAHADMKELFQRKAAIAREQRAAKEQAEETRYAQQVNRDLEGIVKSFAAKHRGLGSQPQYKSCGYCQNTATIDSIGFTTNDGYECQANRADIASTFNGEVHRHLVCINRQTLNTIYLIKIGARWESWVK